MPHPIPTVNGTRPQAILHPGGNRGADLIETIRLERLQASIQAPPNIMDTKLSPARTLFVPEHHSVRPVRPKTAAAARACARPCGGGGGAGSGLLPPGPGRFLGRFPLRLCDRL